MGIYKTTMLTAAALTLASGAAFAGAHGSYPSKPVKIVVGFSAGGGTDTTSRGFASYLHEAESIGWPAGLHRKRTGRIRSKRRKTGSW